jgi:hypothetical protein
MSKSRIQKAVADLIATFEEETVPKGWYTVRQLAAKHGTGPRNVFIIVQKLMRHKHAEWHDYRVRTERGLQPIRHYRLSPSAAKAFGLTTPKH